MEQVEKATSRKIMGIETNDVDEMEEVCLRPPFCLSSLIFWAENERGAEVIALFH
jgi:hypothetical protein